MRRPGKVALCVLLWVVLVAVPGSAVSAAGAPTAPGSITASGGLNTLTVSWTAASGNGSPVTGYDARRRMAIGNDWGSWKNRSLGPSARSTTWHGLAAGTYQTQVRAQNAAGAGPWSQRRTTIVEGPAVALEVSVAPETSPLGARDVTVTARDSAGGVAHSYRGTVTFSRSFSLGLGWQIPNDAVPNEDGNEPFDVEGSIPADYTFTAGDNGAHTFGGGWKTQVALPWGLTATDTTTSSITGSTRIDVPAEIRLKDGKVQARFAWRSSAFVNEVLNGTVRDPRLHGATIEFYDAGDSHATSLPGSGGFVRHVLPAEGWAISHEVSPGHGYGYVYTGDGSTGCSSVKVMILKITASCSAGPLAGPFDGAMQMWLQLGQESDGPAFFCPQFAGSNLAKNTASRVLGRQRAMWDVEDPTIQSTCLEAGTDAINIVDPMAGVPAPVDGDNGWGAYGDEFSADILYNDTAANHNVLSWTLDHASAACNHNTAWLGHWRCGFTTGGTTTPAARARWFQILPPEQDPGPVMHFTTQPDCGFDRDLAYGPDQGTYDGETGHSCTFSDPLTSPYIVSDGLHTARGTVTVNYTTPDPPDYSGVDTSTRDDLSYESDDLVIHTDLSNTGTIVVPNGTNVPVYPLAQVSQIVPFEGVVTIEWTVPCGSCNSSVVEIQATVLQPDIAAQADNDGNIALSNAWIPIRSIKPIVVSGVDNSGGFIPVVTVFPNDPPPCDALVNCSEPPPAAGYAAGGVTVSLFTLRDVCQGGTVQGNLVDDGSPDSADPWECANVNSDANTTLKELGPFCATVYWGNGNYAGDLQETSPGSHNWQCNWTLYNGGQCQHIVFCDDGTTPAETTQAPQERVTARR